MCKKLTYSTLIALVLGLVSSASADLVVHWGLDEGSGTTATDSSGNGNDGTFNGAPEWVEGKIGGGLHVRGDTDQDYVVYTLPGGPTVWETGTIAIWVKLDSLGQDQYSSPFTNHTPNSAGIQFDVNGGTPGEFRLNPGGQFFGPATLDWTHLALTFEDGNATFYYNGEQATTATMSDSQRTFNEFAIGLNRNHTNWVAATIDELRVYDHALTADEIQTIMVSGAGRLPHARRPDPADGATLEQTWISLTWGPGDGAVSHDLYFGISAEDIDSGAEGTFIGNLATTQQVVGFPGFPAPEGLQPGTTYYWRVDEVNDADPNSPWKGAIWSFSVPPRTAYRPSPADGVSFVLSDPTLSWTGGFNAKLHHVYLGDNFDDVSNAVGAMPLPEPTFAPGALEMGKTYYWRVDEFDGAATHKGDVWSFTTVPEIEIADPDLMGWWKLDENMGTTAVDWSGHGRHGSLQGDPQSVAGYDGGALEFDGSNHVDTGYAEDLAEWTIACWVKSPAAPSGASPSGPLHREQNYQFNWNHGNEVFRGAAAMNVGGTWHAAKYTPLSANTWYHLAATYDGNVFNAYRDGVLITSNMAPSGPANSESNSVKLGRHAAAAQFFTGTVDDARVYNRALTVEEIQEVMKGDTSVARHPNPEPGSTPNIGQAAILTWSPGDSAAEHDVYFGTDRAGVADADASDTTGVYRGRQPGASYSTAADIEWGGGPYYWRIDEFKTDSTIGTGWVWSFSVADYLTVDDFESYNDIDPPDPASNRIFDNWIDGFGTTTNGALVGNDLPPYAETTIVHSGAQAMIYAYDNNLKTSEATLTLVSTRDWTAEGVTKLSLWFRGTSGNAADRIFVALNGTAIVYHDDASATQLSGWNEWVIDLGTFGVDLANVNSITIGIGTQNAPAAGGTGTMYFDEIVLIR